MSGSPETVVRQLFERINFGDVDSALELITTDARFVVPPEASAEPDTYEGHEGARRYFDGFEGILDDVHFGLIDLEEVAPGTILAAVRLSGRGAATGIPVAQETHGVLIVRDGLVSYITIYNERQAALEGIRSGLR
jgi:ketosteroid isomerase-like protein